MHHNIISVVKPTRCTAVSNLFYFGMTPYVFRTIFPPITRSLRPYIQQQGICQTDTAVCLLAGTKNSFLYPLATRQQYLFDKCPVAVRTVLGTPDDGWKDRPRRVECHSKIKWIWYVGAACWFYYRTVIITVFWTRLRWLSFCWCMLRVTIHR